MTQLGKPSRKERSVADSLHEWVMTSPRAWQTAVDADIVDEVVEIFSLDYPSNLVTHR
jgi:hypothetical protein